MSIPCRVSQPAPDDVVGRYFAALARQGSPCQIPFALVHGDGSVQWSLYDHAEADGVGILAAMLEDEGSPVPPLPAMRGTAAPGTFASLRHVAQYLRASSGRTTPWTSRWDPAHQPGPELTWVVLSAETTAALTSHARSQRGSLNSLLLWGLHQTPPLWNNGRRLAGIWGVPVNLRGPVQLSNPRANHVSEMPISVEADATLPAIHASIRTGLKEGRYWAPYGVLQQIGRLPDSGLDRFAAARLRRKPEHRFGGLSFLGSWTGSEAILGRAFAPPVDQNLPIGGGAIVYNGRLTLGVRLHGALQKDGIDTRAVMARWLRSLETASQTAVRPIHHGTAAR